jgi:hypothetical protein
MNRRCCLHSGPLMGSDARQSATRWSPGSICWPRQEAFGGQQQAQRKVESSTSRQALFPLLFYVSVRMLSAHFSHRETPATTRRGRDARANSERDVPDGGAK